MMRFRTALLCCVIVLPLTGNAAAVDNPGPDYALQNVLIRYIESGNAGHDARAEISSRLVGYWRQVDEDLPDMTDAEASRVLRRTADLQGEELQDYLLSREYNVAFLRGFTRICIERAQALKEHVARSDAREPLGWLRMMGCYAENPELFFRFNAIGMADGNAVNMMRHFELLARYVAGPVADVLENPSKESNDR